jgi:DMSO reductase anchor subunit
VDKKNILWTVTVFFGTFLLFGGVNEATANSSTGLQAAVRIGVLVLVIVVVVAVVRRRSKP